MMIGNDLQTRICNELWIERPLSLSQLIERTQQSSDKVEGALEVLLDNDEILLEDGVYWINELGYMV